MGNKYKKYIETTCLRLKLEREKSGITILNLSQCLGVFSQKEILMIEEGSLEPNLRYIYRLCELTGSNVVDVIEPYTKKN